MRARRGVFRPGQVSAWLIVAAGFAIYALLVLALGIAGITPILPLPWWVAQAVPPVLYAILVRLFIRHVSVLRWMLATLALWAAHVLLGAVTSVLVSVVGPSLEIRPVEAFPPPILPEILLVDRKSVV